MIHEDMVQELRTFSVQVWARYPQLVSWLHLQSAEGGERVAVDPKMHGTVGEGARMRPRTDERRKRVRQGASCWQKSSPSAGTACSPKSERRVHGHG